MSLHDLLAQLCDFAGHLVLVAKMGLHALAAAPYPFVLSVRCSLARMLKGHTTGLNSAMHESRALSSSCQSNLVAHS